MTEKEFIEELNKIGINPSIEQLNMLNKYYDYAQLLGYVLERFIGKQYNNPLNFDNFIICSELIDKSYQKLGIDLVEYRSYGNVTPDDLAKSKHLERIL